MSGIEIYTLGRANLSYEKFMDILQIFEIKIVVDIRRDPDSDKEPSFRIDWLRTGILNKEKVYHMAAMQLGGLRSAVGNSRHTALEDEILRGYADFMETDNFQRGIVKLIRLASEPLLLLGDDANPKKCHRSLLADALLLHNVHVKHILDNDHIAEHVLNPRANVEDRYIIYNAT